MEKKLWSNPEVFELGVEATQGGGHKPVVHDHVYGQDANGLPYEYYSS